MSTQTRISTFIKVKLKKWDRLTNIDKYRVATHKKLEQFYSEQKYDLDVIETLIFLYINIEKLCLLHLIQPS